MSIRERGLALEELKRRGWVEPRCPHPRDVIRCTGRGTVIVYECKTPHTVILEKRNFNGGYTISLERRRPDFVPSTPSPWCWNKNAKGEWRRWPWVSRVSPK